MTIDIRQATINHVQQKLNQTKKLMHETIDLEERIRLSRLAKKYKLLLENIFQKGI